MIVAGMTIIIMLDVKFYDTYRKTILQSDTAGSGTDYRIHKEYYQAGNEFTRDSKVM